MSTVDQSRRDQEYAERVVEDREDRADLLAYARRHGLTVRWRHSGVPGTDLVPELRRAGASEWEPSLPWPPNGERR